jgi:hypothetical protein
MALAAECGLARGFRQAVRHRSDFTNEQAAPKVLYLVAVQRKPEDETRPGKSLAGRSSSTP